MINKDMFNKICEIEDINIILQIKIKKENDKKEAERIERISKLATFKKGDVVRARVGNKNNEEALMIIKTTCYDTEADVDWSITCYRVVDRRGKEWPLIHTEGSHCDASPEEVTILQRN